MRKRARPTACSASGTSLRDHWHVRTPRWSELDKAFSDDMFLPDGIVEATDSGDWQAALNLPAARGWQVRSPDGTRLEDLSVERLLADDQLHTIAIWPSRGVQINLFPRSLSSIDFDFSTREVVDQASFDVLCDFLRSLGRVVGKPVKVLFEGTDLEILRYEPGSDGFVLAEI